ncbi:MAG: hypothetical protein KAY65_13900 [Planctomycetes bacterium]|nr:hypothetical protein [Planctomycetota bacterium]
MSVEKERAAALTATLKHPTNQTYQKSGPKASSILKDQVGLLLWHLHSPLTYREHKKGWSLFEVLLSARYGRGTV